MRSNNRVNTVPSSYSNRHISSGIISVPSIQKFDWPSSTFNSWKSIDPLPSASTILNAAFWDWILKKRSISHHFGQRQKNTKNVPAQEALNIFHHYDKIWPLNLYILVRWRIGNESKKERSTLVLITIVVTYSCFSLAVELRLFSAILFLLLPSYELIKRRTRLFISQLSFYGTHLVPGMSTEYGLPIQR